MASSAESQFVKDLANKKMTITRHFDAEVALVWLTWTEQELLDQWWAPKPWRAETKSFDFREGGQWLYSMVGPNNERHWSAAIFGKIEFEKSFDATDFFCDEDGTKNSEVQETYWHNEFHPTATGTKVVVVITATEESGLNKMLEMGFEEGFTMALGNLDQYLKAQFKIRKQLRSYGKPPRVSSYLNFPGTAEDAFTFYKSVFKTEFSGRGIKRFGDIPAETGHPPVAENVKKMVLHVELPITGGHVLMATDSPKEMGFELTQGTNMHICVEPDSREETKRIFDGLAQGGNITMPLQDMFFGAYFGTITDRFGINWMFNFIE
jgi:PhnB protein